MRKNKKNIALIVMIIISLIIILTIIIPQKYTTRHKMENLKRNEILIITTNSILESIVKELINEKFKVHSTIPNGFDLHEWEPSAKDIQMLSIANIIVENGIQLESGLIKAIDRVKKTGTKVFTASEYINLRYMQNDNHSQTKNIKILDPHIWTDPITVKEFATALAIYIKNEFSIDLTKNADSFNIRLMDLHNELQKEINTIPSSQKKIVTGHDDLGYFAKRYDIQLIGAIIPNITTEAESSATNLNKLKKLITDHKISHIFIELGTPLKTTEALAKEINIQTIPLSTHNLPNDKSYFSFERQLAKTITMGLK